MALARRLHYYRRILSAYLTGRASHLTFWHDVPTANPNAPSDRLGEYYMEFAAKADYAGPFDAAGVPLLDYHGSIGKQYNPIAIAQYGLGNYNLWKRHGEPERKKKFLTSAAWLVANLQANAHGVAVWNHHFDWEYRTPLKAPWYSGLAQGQGISLLVRAHDDTGEQKYKEAAARAYGAFAKAVDAGGVCYHDPRGYTWIEEYLVSPPTHILNGFIWAAWGVHDYELATGDAGAGALFRETTRTIADHLPLYDAGFWSLYEQSGTRMRMLASPFYHRLHIVQLGILHRLTGNAVFSEYAERWARYEQSAWRKSLAVAHKSLFKLAYY